MPTTELDYFSDMARFEDKTPISLPEALRAGSHLQYLRQAAEETHKIGTVEEDKISGSLIDCAQILRSSTLETTITHQLVAFAEELQQNYETSDTIGDEDAKELERKSSTWQRVLREDLQREQRIPASDAGPFNVNGLLNNPQMLFSEPVWNWLDSRPQEDIREASKTLVVGCSTSSVFLSLRAVEHCLGDWYESEMGEQIDQEGWGGVLNQLINEFLADTDSNDILEQLGELPPVLSNLYYLKEKRNEVNHPEKSPDPHEARRTLMITTSTIRDIYGEIVDTSSILYNNTEIEIPDDKSDEERIKDLISELDRLTDGGVPRQEIYDSARQMGFGSEEAEEHIISLLMSGYMYEPSEGVLKPI